MTYPIPGPHKLSPEILVRAYAAGVFPMSESSDDPTIFWVDPKWRGVVPLGGLHISKSLRKVLRKGEFKVTCNQAFSRVIAACAEPRPEAPNEDDANDTDPTGEVSATWINAEIIRAYTQMHEIGLAHSIEVWRGDVLVGGLYGICLKGAFMGESMFSRASNASKVALAHLVARLKLGGFALLDTQFITPHLSSMGAIEISGQDYQDLLEHALTVIAQFPVDPDPSDVSSMLERMFSQPKTQTL